MMLLLQLFVSHSLKFFKSRDHVILTFLFLTPDTAAGTLDSPELWNI